MAYLIGLGFCFLLLSCLLWVYSFLQRGMLCNGMILETFAAVKLFCLEYTKHKLKCILSNIF